jgi:hypothetical protein
MNGKGNNGGAIYNFNVAPKFNNLVIRNNEATTSGGGIYNLNAPVIFSNTLIKDNTALYGGGIRNNGSASEFTNVIIKNNTATQNDGGAGGGGIFNENAVLKLTNVLITGNSTALGGGGIRNLSGNSIFTNVTMAGNEAAITASKAIEIAGGNPQISNSVIYGTISGTYNAQYSLVEGNTSTANGNVNATLYTITGVFTNPAGGDFSLRNGSPAVDNGSNALFAVLDVNTKDLAGNARVYHYANSGKIDLGAYESSYTTIVSIGGIVYVKTTATGKEDGSSWDDATTDLHNAIHAAGVQKVFVAVGNYNVGANSFVMKNGVAIYGGFDPDNDVTDLTHKRIMPSPVDGGGSVLNGQNTRPVIWNVFTNATALDHTAVLDGFTITGGRSNLGGGMYNMYASPTLTNLAISGNTATNNAQYGAAYGGGIYLGSSSPQLTNVVISDNIASSLSHVAYGGGMAIFGGAASHPVLKNVTVANNTITSSAIANATRGGGVFVNNNSAIEIYNSLIWGNQKDGNVTLTGSDIEGVGSAVITMKNTGTQGYAYAHPAENNLPLTMASVFVDPANRDYRLSKN